MDYSEPRRRPHSRAARCGNPRRPRAGRGGLEIVHSGELGWVTPQGRGTAAALLVEIDSGGLVLLADAAPDGLEPVCLRLIWPLATPWIAGSIVACRRTRIGPSQVRLVPRRWADVAAFLMLTGLDPRHN